MIKIIHIYTGDGKGKTTAAIGLCVRCCGSGKKVLFAQFLKNNKSSERNLLSKCENIHVLDTPPVEKFVKDMSTTEICNAKTQCQCSLDTIISISKNYDMIILDEIISSVNLGLVDLNSLLNLLKDNEREFILTGRDPHCKLVEIADYVSEIKCIKHPYCQGVVARVGIEY